MGQCVVTTTEESLTLARRSTNSWAKAASRFNGTMIKSAGERMDRSIERWMDETLSTLPWLSECECVCENMSVGARGWGGG